jgi:predicted TIM-barrel fold metal-dependent hydrolase
MIVDFQHHFTPRVLIDEDPGEGKITRYDEQGVPSYSIHKMLWDLDEHIRMMDIAGIDLTVLSCAEGMSAPLDRSIICNDEAKKAEKDYPGRFVGIAHANPLGGADAIKEK